MPAEAPIQAERADLKRIMCTSIPVVPNSEMSFKSIHGIGDYFYLHPSIVRQSFKGEKLTPLAQQYFEEKARADTAQAQADLNAQRAGQAEIRAEVAEAEVTRLQAENAQLEANAILDFKERQEADLRITSLWGQINRLKQGKPQQSIFEALGGQASPTHHWAVLGLDPKTAFAGLTDQQKQAVLDGAYRTRSKIFHPDNRGSEEAMQKVNAAYEALKASIK